MKTPTVTPVMQPAANDLHLPLSINESLVTDKPMPQPSVKGKVFRTTDLWRLRRQSRTQGLVIR